MLFVIIHFIQVIDSCNFLRARQHQCVIHTHAAVVISSVCSMFGIQDVAMLIKSEFTDYTCALLTLAQSTEDTAIDWFLHETAYML